MAKNYRNDTRVPGATEEERQWLNELHLNGRQLARDIGISHTTYHKFKRGEPTAEWIREAIMKVAHRKHQKLEELKAIAKD